FSGSGFLSSKSKSKVGLNSVMDAAGVSRFKCSPGYIGFDCLIPIDKTLSKLLCYLKGVVDPNSTSPSAPTAPTISTAPTASNSSAADVTPTAAPTGPDGAPDRPLDARAACPLIVDIQKYMNKCVEDVLN
ncbi:hypothetical protein BB560_006003, partial [Smittium megazygosporum]